MTEQHEKALVPQIRFAGFTDPWEQRKLGEVATGFEYGLNAAALAFDGKNKYLRITDIDDQTHEFRADDLSSPCVIGSIDDRYILEEGDVLFARTGASVGKTYLYKPSDGKTYYAGFLIRAHVSEEADAGFIFQSTLTEQYRQFILLTSQRSGQPGINAKEYSDFLLPLPSLPEQRKIGAFFDRLDSLITLHQRKYDKLYVLKKSMLDKMFPKGGSLYPEIRFAGFTDPWEQRKLGELYQKNDERNIDRLGVERTLSVASMTFNSAGNGADESSLPNYKRLRLGDIAFEGHTNKEFAYGRFVLNDAGNGIMSPRFTCLRPIAEQEYSFWKYFIHSEKVMRQILVNSTKSGTMMNELVIEDFLKQGILVPPLPEQRKIGAFFDRLDSLITLHQRKLELLRNIKKSMLDKMFV